MSCILCGKEEKGERRLVLGGRVLTLCPQHFNLIERARSAKTTEEFDKSMSNLSDMLNSLPEESRILIENYINNSDPAVADLNEIKKDIAVIKGIAIIFLVVMILSILFSFIAGYNISKAIDEATRPSYNYDLDDYDSGF